MAETVSWLHLSDLHFGLDDQSWLWPKLKFDLFTDIKKLTDQTGGWDLVFFTGDFVQKGSADEFDGLNVELDRLWKILSVSGKSPALCFVPGNHDLTRPPAGGALSKAFTQLWWQDGQLRRQFWRDAECEYRKALEGYFENYTIWISQLQVPTLFTTFQFIV